MQDWLSTALDVLTARADALTALAAVLTLVGGAIAWLFRKPGKPANGTGGRGGNANVRGNGIAIGGKGGMSGAFGHGGDGGSAKVHGAGLAAGGEGGHACEAGVLRPPARSGYEVARRAQGLPIDPLLKQFGRGGCDPRYYMLLRFTLDLIEPGATDGIEDMGLDPEYKNELSLDEINKRLWLAGASWSVHLLDGQYEFHV